MPDIHQQNFPTCRKIKFLPISDALRLVITIVLVATTTVNFLNISKVCAQVSTSVAMNNLQQMLQTSSVQIESQDYQLRVLSSEYDPVRGNFRLYYGFQKDSTSGPSLIAYLEADLSRLLTEGIYSQDSARAALIESVSVALYYAEVLGQMDQREAYHSLHILSDISTGEKFNITLYSDDSESQQRQMKVSGTVAGDHYVISDHSISEFIQESTQNPADTAK